MSNLGYIQMSLKDPLLFVSLFCHLASIILCALILSETLALYKSFTYLLTYLYMTITSWMKQEGGPSDGWSQRACVRGTYSTSAVSTCCLQYNATVAFASACKRTSRRRTLFSYTNADRTVTPLWTTFREHHEVTNYTLPRLHTKFGKRDARQHRCKVIWTQFTVEICDKAWNREKFTKKQKCLRFSRSLKVIDVETLGMFASNACYDKQQVCVYLEPFSR